MAFRFFASAAIGAADFGIDAASLTLPPSSAAPLEFNFFKKFNTASRGFHFFSSAVVLGFDVAPPKLLRCSNFGVLTATAAPSAVFLFICNRVLFNGTPEDDPDMLLLCKEGIDAAFPANGGGGGILLPPLTVTPGVVLCVLLGVVVERFGCGEDGIAAKLPEERSS